MTSDFTSLEKSFTIFLNLLPYSPKGYEKNIEFLPSCFLKISIDLLISSLIIEEFSSTRYSCE